MAMFVDIFTALLALGAAVAWVLTGRDKLPPDWDRGRTGSTDKKILTQSLGVTRHLRKDLSLADGLTADKKAASRIMLG